MDYAKLTHIQETFASVRKATTWAAVPPLTHEIDTLLDHVERARDAVLSALLDTSSAEHVVQLSELLHALTPIESDLRRAVTAQEWAPVASIHTAVARLRTATSHASLLEIAAAELVTLGFTRVMLSCVNGERWFPLMVVNHDHPASPETVTSSDRLPELRITRNLVEFELISRRRTIVVDDVAHNPRAHSRFRSLMPVSCYVATPVLIAGESVGMIHVGRGDGEAVREADCAVLSAFAACLGFASETLTMTRRLSVILREATLTPDHILGLTDDVLHPIQRPVSSTEKSAAPPGTSPHCELTAREQEVMQLMSTGKRNGEIAEELVVSESTVKAHVKNILKKLGAANRAAAVARYFQSQ